MSSNASMMLSGLFWYKTTSKQVKTIIKKNKDKIKQNKKTGEKSKVKDHSMTSSHSLIPRSTV